MFTSVLYPHSNGVTDVEGAISNYLKFSVWEIIKFTGCFLLQEEVEEEEEDTLKNLLVTVYH